MQFPLGKERACFKELVNCAKCYKYLSKRTYENYTWSSKDQEYEGQE